MFINELSGKQCSEILSRIPLGRLGCALDGQPYVLPIYFAYDGKDIFALSTLGQKIEWMRANPKVCLQVDEILGNSEWSSVVALGRFQELPEPQFAAERAHARSLLENRHHWWINALAERRMKSSDLAAEALFFRIQIDSLTGLHAAPEKTEP